jgi:hypothetical protein
MEVSTRPVPVTRPLPVASSCSPALRRLPAVPALPALPCLPCLCCSLCFVLLCSALALVFPTRLAPRRRLVFLLRPRSSHFSFLTFSPSRLSFLFSSSCAALLLPAACCLHHVISCSLAAGRKEYHVPPRYVGDVKVLAVIRPCPFHASSASISHISRLLYSVLPHYESSSQPASVGFFDRGSSPSKHVQGR